MIELLRIRQEGDRVLVLYQGRKVMDLTWDAALDVARALHATGKKAEEIAKAHNVIADNGLLLRVGVPVGLTDHPDIMRESIRFAINDRNLRRYLPWGVKSQEAVGTPTIIQKEPAKSV